MFGGKGYGANINGHKQHYFIIFGECTANVYDLSSFTKSTHPHILQKWTRTLKT